jgi:hypothetical protein
VIHPACGASTSGSTCSSCGELRGHVAYMSIVYPIAKWYASQLHFGPTPTLVA